MKLPTMEIATSVRYGNYKEHLNNALFYVKEITRTFDSICNYISLPKRNLTIKFRPIRGGLFGCAYVVGSSTRSYVVEIDVRQDSLSFYDTLLHELVHVEQFYQNRLCGNSKPGYFKWGSKFISYNTESEEEYNNLPWEREALERASLLQYVIFD